MVFFRGYPSPSLEPRSKSDGEDIPADPTGGSQGKNATLPRPTRPIPRLRQRRDPAEEVMVHHRAIGAEGVLHRRVECFG